MDKKYRFILVSFLVSALFCCYSLSCEKKRTYKRLREEIEFKRKEFVSTLKDLKFAYNDLNSTAKSLNYNYSNYYREKFSGKLYELNTMRFSDVVSDSSYSGSLIDSLNKNEVIFRAYCVFYEDYLKACGSVDSLSLQKTKEYLVNRHTEFVMQVTVFNQLVEVYNRQLKLNFERKFMPSESEIKKIDLIGLKVTTNKFYRKK